MKPVLSREQMRAYDKHAIEACQVPGLVLMENAGRGAADVLGRIAPLRGTAIVVVCGAGNNGGDGFVVARHLLARGAATHVFLIGSSEQVTGEARINHDAYIDLGGRFTELPESGDFDAFVAALATTRVVVDAIFGTGLGRPIQGHMARVIDAINGCSALRFSLDLPSGLDADTGFPLGVAVQAHHTVTFGHLKVGLLTPEGARLAGTVHVVDLGVPETIVKHTGHVGQVLDASSVSPWLKPREANIYKHQAGSVSFVAGSPGKVGAALLGAKAALRAGAGLSTIVSWPEVAVVLEARASELMTGRIDRADVSGSLDRALAGQNAVVVGPGLGLDDTARAVVEHVVRTFEGTVVVDADAITHFAGRPGALREAGGKLVLTPHSGEMGRLLGISPIAVEQDRFGAARTIARETGAVVLLKGARTIIAEGSDVLINATGNPALATAGAGDVLAGIIAAFACSLSPVKAAALGAFVHGLAADRWRDQHGGVDRGLFASDLSALLPYVLGDLLAGRVQLATHLSSRTPARRTSARPSACSLRCRRTPTRARRR